MRAIDGAEDKIKDVIRQMYDFVTENFGIYFTASASKRHTFNELSEAYFEALSASKTEQSDEITVFYEDSGMQELDYAFDSKTEQILLNFIKAGEKQKAPTLFVNFWKRTNRCSIIKRQLSA